MAEGLPPWKNRRQIIPGAETPAEPGERAVLVLDKLHVEASIKALFLYHSVVWNIRIAIKAVWFGSESSILQGRRGSKNRN